MDGYPINLILTVAIASTTLFLGFLPTKTFRPEFFVRETLWAALAWLVVAVLSPPAILHYPLIFATLCLAAWWQFREDNIFKAKMWLTLASALSISIGVIVILAVTARANPAGLSQLNEILLLVSIYLGGVIIGLAYFCFTLTQSAKVKSGASHGLIHRYVRLLFFLTVARTEILLAELWLPGTLGDSRRDGVGVVWENNMPIRLSASPLPIHETILVPLLVLISVAYLAERASRFHSRISPVRFLVALITVGFFSEVAFRFLNL